MKNLRIAIDGTAASGKSTTAKLLAQRLGLLPVDTGAMYRAVTLKALRLGISPTDEEGLARMLQETEIRQELGPNGTPRTYLDGEDVTDQLKDPLISRWVSEVSAHPKVRRILVKLQRKIAEGRGVVIEGRDIGTVVLPDADLKVYMTASLEERARRRMKELEEKGIRVSYQEVIQDLEKRDMIDSTRQDSPLQVPEDAFILDTTDLSIEEQVEAILKELRRRLGDQDP